MRCARNVHFSIKPGKVDEFKHLLEAEITSTFRKQKGFHDQLTLLHETTGVSISVWEDRAFAEEFHAKVFPEAMKKLRPVLEDTPRVEYFDVILSPVHA